MWTPVLKNLGGLIFGPPGNLLRCQQGQLWTGWAGRFLGLWEAGVALVMAVAAVGKSWDLPVAYMGTTGGSSGLGRPVTRPPGGTWRWVLVGVVVTDSVAPPQLTGGISGLWWQLVRQINPQSPWTVSIHRHWEGFCHTGWVFSQAHWWRLWA